LNIRQIRYFVKVVAAGSLSKAAESVRLSQPALGLQIRKLEAELGTPLLFRHSRGVVPTEEGRVLYERFLIILREIDLTPQFLAGLSGPPKGTVSLGVTASMGLALVPALIHACPVRFPRVTLRLVEGVSEAILQGVEEGRLDLGLSGVRHDSGYLSCEPLTVEDMFLIGPRGHQAAGEKPIRLSEVVKHPLILPTGNHPIRKLIDEALRKHHLTTASVLELDSVLLKKELVLQSGMLTILPYSAVHREHRNGSMFARAIAAPRIVDTMYLVASNQRPRSRATLAVQEQIHRSVEDLIKSGTWRWRPVS
jgi:LysR family nitrogen assimilation transcriptional regulator